MIDNKQAAFLENASIVAKLLVQQLIDKTKVANLTITGWDFYLDNVHIITQNRLIGFYCWCETKEDKAAASAIDILYNDIYTPEEQAAIINIQFNKLLTQYQIDGLDVFSKEDQEKYFNELHIDDYLGLLRLEHIAELRKALV